MILGFYYHIPARVEEGKIYVPSYLGLFLDSLAEHTRQLVLFLHQAGDADIPSCNYPLQTQQVRLINLGYKKPAWHRALFGASFLRRFMEEVVRCDLLLLRAPTPLSAAFYKVFGKKTKLAYMLVGDYVAGAPHLQLPLLRKAGIYAMSVYLDRSLKKVARHCCILSNSHEILEKFSPYTDRGHFIRTTTLRRHDFFERVDTCQRLPCKLLFTGRFDFAKGLRELLEACAGLVKEGMPLQLHLAGWEDTPAQPVLTWLKERSITLGIAEIVVNHGKLKHGKALNDLYRSADIYVLPSYHEGFPRTIWEAMANSLPVIATTVGSIPHTLSDNRNALLIAPKSADEVADAIRKLMVDAALRRRLIAEGRRLAEDATLEIQTEKLIGILAEHLQVPGSY